MKIKHNAKPTKTETGAAFSQSWVAQNEAQLRGYASMAAHPECLGSISRAVVTAWHESARDYAIMTGTGGSPHPPALGSKPGLGGGFAWAGGVATFNERGHVVHALMRTGFESIAKRVARPPLSDHTLTVVAFVGDRADVFQVTITKPGDAEASKVIL